MIMKAINNKKTLRWIHVLVVVIAVVMSLSMCSCDNAKDGEKGKMMQSITVVSEEYAGGYPQKETFTLSGEDSDKLLEILSPDSLNYSEDVIKTGPEKSSTIFIGANEKLSINREENDESLVYMIRSYNGHISGTYISSMSSIQLMRFYLHSRQLGA